MTALVLIMFNALVLCALLYLFARDTADYEFQKVAIVAACILVGNKVLQWTLAPYLDAFVALPMAAFTLFMLVRFCWVTVRQAVLILILFALCQGLIALARDALVAWAAA